MPKEIQCWHWQIIIAHYTTAAKSARWLAEVTSWNMTSRPKQSRGIWLQNEAYLSQLRWWLACHKALLWTIHCFQYILRKTSDLSCIAQIYYRSICREIQSNRHHKPISEDRKILFTLALCVSTPHLSHLHLVPHKPVSEVLQHWFR